MLAHSQGFKNSINGFGRELDVKITYYGNNGYLATQDNKLVLTEDNMKILMEENENNKVRLQIDSDDIYKLEKNNLGELFRTYMKSFDLETTTDLEIGSIVNVEIGCKVDDEYEYLNYGHYIVYTKNYNEDTKTYEYQLCDYMLKTMIPFDAWQIFEANENKLGVAIRDICDYCGLPRPDTDDVPNKDVYVYRKTFEGYNLTCRDVLDMLLQASGVSLRMNDETPEIIVWQGLSVDTINEDNLKNKNVKFVEKFGPINSLVFSRADGNDNLERKDDESIAEYGETQYVIKDNPILEQENREDFIDNLFAQMIGLQYYECDIELIGLEYLEYMDRFNVQIGDNAYDCLCLKNTSSIKNGLTENLKSEAPQEKTTEYVNGGISDKKASLILDKLKGEIVLKTNSDGKLAQVRLDSSGDDGSLVEIDADNINLNGYISANGAFTIDNSGNIRLYDDSYYLNPSVSKSFKIENPTQNTSNNLYSNSIVIHKKLTGSDEKYELAMGWGMSDNALLLDSWVPHINSTQHRTSLQLTDNDNTYRTTGMYITKEWMEGGSTLAMLEAYYAWDECYVNGPCKATSFVNISSVDEKKNIEQVDIKGLDIIKDIDIYKFNYNNEEDSDKKHIGLIIGDDYKYSQEITNKDNNGVDVYSLVSVCCKAIQEQQKEIEELKEEIQKLKENK